LGPVLIGISLSLSTYFEVAARRAGLGDQATALLASGWLHALTRALPALLEFVAFALLFSLLPNCAVRWRDGALGALIATIAIEVLKIGFAAYIDSVSYYSTVYGALAAIPIFLLWMYISWMAVLLGAIVAAALPNWRIGAGQAPAAALRLGLGLALIAALADAQRRGEPAATRTLAAELGVATTVVDEHIRPLVEGGFAAHTQGGRWVLAWNPETATLRDLFAALQLPLAAGWTGRPRAPWQARVAPAMARIAAAEADAMQLTIALLLADAGASDNRRCRRSASGAAAKQG
jgi:membrane protein